MKKVMLFVSSMVLLFGMGASMAATTPTFRMGIIDLRTVLQEAKEVKTITTSLKDQFQPRRDKIVKADGTLKANLEKLKRDGSIMTESTRNSLRDKIVAERRSLIRMQQDFQQDATVAQNQAMKTFLEKVNKVVEGVAGKEGYEIVLQKSAVPYSSDTLDITKQVLKKLNRS